MILVKVWCLPKENQEKLKAVFDDIVNVFVQRPIFGAASEKDLTVLFPSDMMEYDLGSDIAIEVTGILTKENPDKFYLHKQYKGIARRLAITAQEHFLEAKRVQCFLTPFDRSGNYHAEYSPDQLLPLDQLLAEQKISKELYANLVESGMRYLNDVTTKIALTLSEDELGVVGRLMDTAEKKELALLEI